METEKTRLNACCGRDIRPEYLNMDVVAYDGVNVVADVRAVNFKPESFTEILWLDAIEHVLFHEAKAILRKFHKWLKPNGILTIHTDNLPFLAQQLAGGGDYDNAYHYDVLKWIYGVSATGEETCPYRFHYWGYSKESLCKVLVAIGYSIIDTVVDCNGFGLSVVACKTVGNNGKAESGKQ